MKRYERVVHVGLEVEKQIVIVDGTNSVRDTYRLASDKVRWEHSGSRKISEGEALSLLANRRSKGYRLVLDIPIEEGEAR